MQCPNCSNPKLHTVETFQTPDATIRKKKCQACQWTFTSREEVCDDIVIPQSVRMSCRKEDPNEIHKRKRLEKV